MDDSESLDSLLEDVEVEEGCTQCGRRSSRAREYSLCEGLKFSSWFGPLMAMGLLLFINLSCRLGEAMDSRPLSPALSMPANRTAFQECGITLLANLRSLHCGPRKIEYLPWMASLKLRDSFCTGSLLNERFVLVAAHCAPQWFLSLITVRLGDFDEVNRNERFRHETYSVKRVIVHEKYNTTTGMNNIALLELAELVIFRKTIAPICLRNNEDIAPGDAAFISHRPKYEMEKLDAKITDLEACRSTSDLSSTPLVLDDSKFLCVTPTGQLEDGHVKCLSRADLFLQRGGRAELIGIASHRRYKCSPDNPVLFTRISGHWAWIMRNMEVSI